MKVFEGPQYHILEPASLVTMMTICAKNQTSYKTDSGWKKIEQIDLSEVNLSDIQTHEQPVSYRPTGEETCEVGLNLSDIQTHEQPVSCTGEEACEATFKHIINQSVRCHNGAETREGNLTPLACSTS